MLIARRAVDRPADFKMGSRLKFTIFSRGKLKEGQEVIPAPLFGLLNPKLLSQTLRF
jgi:hypothetical protein